MNVVYYNGEHSVTFGDKNTWDDWHLIPTSRPMFAPPAVKTNSVDIPGANGSLDLTEVLTGYPLYENRTGTMEFIVDPKYKKWNLLYSEILNYLHGQRMEAVLSDEPNFSYIGRFGVNAWKSDEHYSSITIEYNTDPYKYELTSTDEDWRWDPFSFETGIIRNYKDIVVDEERSVPVYGSELPIIPVFVLESGSLTVSQSSKGPYTLETGENLFPDMGLSHSSTTSIVFTFVGNGTVSIRYRAGRL